MSTTNEKVGHTRGPLIVTEFEDGEIWVQAVENGEPWPTATTEPDHAPIEVRRANAHLYAAAPDLLAACKALLPLLQADLNALDGWEREIDALESALALAEPH